MGVRGVGWESGGLLEQRRLGASAICRQGGAAAASPRPPTTTGFPPAGRGTSGAPTPPCRPTEHLGQCQGRLPGSHPAAARGTRRTALRLTRSGRVVWLFTAWPGDGPRLAPLQRCYAGVRVIASMTQSRSRRLSRPWAHAKAAVSMSKAAWTVGAGLSSMARASGRATSRAILRHSYDAACLAELHHGSYQQPFKPSQDPVRPPPQP